MDQQQDSGQHERLRSSPSERFVGESHAFDVHAVLRILRAEAHPAERGHRQVTIFHRAPVTQIIFAFEPGGALADHTAHGLVTMHVLEGRLTVRTDEGDYALSAGYVLVLTPDVHYHVHAPEASAMLLTVHLDGTAR
jgi:quercetin dioxygenase-like cupin family protein